LIEILAKISGIGPMPLLFGEVYRLANFGTCKKLSQALAEVRIMKSLRHPVVLLDDVAFINGQETPVVGVVVVRAERNAIPNLVCPLFVDGDNVARLYHIRLKPTHGAPVSVDVSHAASKILIPNPDGGPSQGPPSVGWYIFEILVRQVRSAEIYCLNRFGLVGASAGFAAVILGVDVCDVLPEVLRSHGHDDLGLAIRQFLALECHAIFQRRFQRLSSNLNRRRRSEGSVPPRIESRYCLFTVIIFVYPEKDRLVMGVNY